MMLLHASFHHSPKMIYVILCSVRLSITIFFIKSYLLGSYQIKMAKSYIVEHLRPSDINEEQIEFTVELCREHEDLIRARFQSRHSNRKRHVATIQFNEKDEQPIQGWY